MSHAGRQDLSSLGSGCTRTMPSTTSIYAAAEVPLIERMAKAARRTFLVKPVWATGADLDELYRKNDRQHRAIREAIAARSPQGARVLAREHVLSSGRLLEAILDKVASQTREPAAPTSATRRSPTRARSARRRRALEPLVEGARAPVERVDGPAHGRETARRYGRAGREGARSA